MQMAKHKRAAALLVLAAALALPTRLWAGGFTITILGGRRTAMSTNLARPDDITALFHNPAGLADLRGVRVHLSTSLTFLNTEFGLMALDPERFPEINPAGCGEPGSDPCPWPIDSEGYYVDEIEPERYFGILPYLGASTDLGFASSRLKDVVVSAAVYAPDFYGAFLPDDAPTAYHIIEGSFLVLATTVGAGWRINRYVSVGANLSYNYMRLSYAQKMSTIDALTPAGQAPDGVARAAQSLLGDFRLDYTGVDHGMGWGAGVLVNPLPWLALGFNYNGATPARFEGDLSLRALGNLVKDQPDALANNLRAFGYKVPVGLTVEMPIPHSLQFGVNFAPLWWLEVGIDYRLWLYSFYKKQDLIPHYAADDPGKEEPLSRESLSRDKRYHESYELAGGVLLRPLTRYRGLELMLGTFFDQSPIPDETFTMDNPSLSQIALSMGARALFAGHWRVAASYMVIWYLERDVTTSETSPPTNARGRGLAHLPGIELEYVF